jgi:hypothetical protein
MANTQSEPLRLSEWLSLRRRTPFRLRLDYLRTTSASANCRQMSADGGGMAGFDQRRSAKIDVADAGERTDGGDHGRTNKANSDNF